MRLQVRRAALAPEQARPQVIESEDYVQNRPGHGEIAAGRRPTVVGIDVGGTFIDFVVFRDGKPMFVLKHLSRPADVGGAVIEGLAQIGDLTGASVVHGTTIATNALIQRSGARTALVTTSGFADIIEIGRQDRPALYDLNPLRPPSLVPRDLRYEVSERVGPDGTVLRSPSDDEVEEVATRLVADGVNSAAVCLLFSFLNPEHEKLVAAALVRAGIGFVTTSHEVVPEFREYERTTTTVANAFVSPLLNDYLGQVDEALRHQRGVQRFDVMQSNGGLLSAPEATRNGVRMLLSGPAAGVAGAFDIALEHGIDHIITFDMGGTSTDVALCDGAIPSTTERILAGVPIRVSMVDVETVGAGGGSIARVDSGGGLRVGPESAGADPGPACFGRGRLATVTDAQAVVGLLDPDSFLGGRLPLDLTRAYAVVEDVAARAGLTAEATAEGILRVAEASMERAIRRISVERGHDPRDFVLVAFGGAGPIHACALADALAIPRILVPPYPGVVSAVGMARADMSRDFSQTVLGVLPDDRRAAWDRLEAQAHSALPTGQITRTAECRYEGQGYELEVPADPYESLPERFHAAHQRRFGYADASRSVQFVTARVTVRQPRPLPIASPWQPNRKVWNRTGRLLMDGKKLTFPIIERSSLRIGLEQLGPALVVQADSATLIGKGWRATAFPDGCLEMERR